LDQPIHNGFRNRSRFRQHLGVDLLRHCLLPPERPQQHRGSHRPGEERDPPAKPNQRHQHVGSGGNLDDGALVLLPDICRLFKRKFCGKQRTCFHRQNVGILSHSAGADFNVATSQKICLSEFFEVKIVRNIKIQSLDKFKKKINSCKWFSFYFVFHQ
jgi:hypothetical protein